ncbi:MAG: hypothetical protein IAG10_25325 [Planctomycetaceae bacterium]|nr:hypothetical protein [Planctomycetaceae bacterium]
MRDASATMSPSGDMLPKGNIAVSQEAHARSRHSVISRGFWLSVPPVRRGTSFAFVIPVFIRIAQFVCSQGVTTVNQRLVAEFAAMVAAQAPLIIEGTTPLAEGPLWVYWQHSKTLWPRCRHELEELCSQSDAAATADRIPRMIATASDLLVGELLTRVAGAVLTACDRRQRLQRGEPIARNVLAVHQQCRASVLRVLLHSTSLPVDQLAELDRLRRRVERWVDVLLGPLVAHYGDELSDFAFDPRRARDFGEEQSQARFQSISHPRWSFLLAGLRSAFPSDPTAISQNDPSMPIVRSILALFPDNVFQSEGPIQSLRQSRIVRSSEQTEGPPELADHSLQRLRHDLASASRRAPPPPSQRRT